MTSSGPHRGEPAPFTDTSGKLAELTNWVYVGSGVSGTVWRADQPRLNRTIAVKRFHAQVTGRRHVGAFEDEVKALGALYHRPGVIDLIDALTDDEGHPVLLMRFYGRGSFDQMLAKLGPQDAREITEVGRRLATELAAAHAMQIVHRDVKPANILISDDDEPVLSDFGIAAVGGRLSDTRYWASTPLHAAPEILEQGGVSPAADVWSLASTMVTLMTGAAPFEPEPGDGDGVEELLLRIRTGNMRPLPEHRVPAELRDVLRRALDPDPANRTTSAADFAARLQDVQLSQRWSRSTPAPRPQPPDSVFGLSQTNLTPLTPQRSTCGAPQPHAEKGTGWEHTSLNPLAPERPPDAASQTDEGDRKRRWVVAAALATTAVLVFAVVALIASRPGATHTATTRTTSPRTSPIPSTSPQSGTAGAAATPTGVKVHQEGTTVIVTWSGQQPASAIATVVSDGTTTQVATGQRYEATRVPVGAPRCYSVGWVDGLQGRPRYSDPVCINGGAPVAETSS
ncbi:serine/threonine-protein kinase [uncultured Jatrophihabitans sp.]|uniref:serine/threonine-protein kinase n=1 Tax=uncultured Jatrophihabitans sp. TaxID=1610747 RepID=UPI0035C99681